MPVKVIFNFIVGNCDGNYRYQYFRFPWRLCKSSEIKRKSFLTRFPCTTQYQHELVPFGHIDALIGNQLGWHCVSFADREQCECLASGNHHFCCPMRGIMYINIENYHPTPTPNLNDDFRSTSTTSLPCTLTLTSTLISILFVFVYTFT